MSELIDTACTHYASWQAVAADEDAVTLRVELDYSEGEDVLVHVDSPEPVELIGLRCTDCGREFDVPQSVEVVYA